MAFLDDIMSGIGTVGEAMQAPRKWLWRDLLGLPETGEELLAEKFGWDRNSPWTKGAGFALEQFGDPVTWTPWAVGKLAGMLGRGVLAGRGAALAEGAAPNIAKAWEASPVDELAPAVANYLGPAASASPTERFMGAGAMRRMTPNRAPAASASPYFDELLAKYPQAKDINIYQNVDMLDDAATAQLRAMRDAGQRMPYGLHGGVVSKGGSGPVGFTAEPVNIADRSVSPLARTMKSGLTEEELTSRNIAGLQGAYNPDTNTIIAMRGAEPATLPHELMHGLTWQGALTGEVDHLPFLQRMAAKLYQPYAQEAAQVGTGAATKNLRSGLASIFDETGSWALENPTFGNQVAGAARYLLPKPANFLRSMMDPENLSSTAWNYYGHQAGRHSPWAHLLYQGIGSLPYLAGAGAAGVGAGVIAGRNYLGD